MAQTKFERPIIVISKCLIGAACRWDGDRLNWPLARLLKVYARLVPVCPELEIGLGIPRPKIQVVEQNRTLSLHQPSSGKDLTRTMTTFSHRHLSGLTEVDGFLLKSRSPSCGLRDTKHFDSPDEDARMIGRGPGLYALAVVAKNPDIAVEDENRLENNHAIREHWLTRVFASAAFRSVKKQPSPGRLRNFHRYHEKLLFVYSQKRTRELARLAFAATPDSVARAVSGYEAALSLALKRPARTARMVDSMAPALEYYAQHLDRSEVRQYHKLAERCLAREAPINDLRKQIQIWAVRYDKNFIRKHSLYRPYPGALAPA